MRARALSLAAVLTLLAAPAPGQQPAELMDRLEAVLVEGAPVEAQVMFEALETDHDLDLNLVLADAQAKRDEKGRALLLAARPYERDGRRYRFVFVVRAGQLQLFDLQVEADGEWASVEQRVFWFQPLDERPATELLEGGGAVLYLRGWATRGRGGPRARASMALRTGHGPAGRPPSY